jgi:hypothetical protein
VIEVVVSVAVKFPVIDVPFPPPTSNGTAVYAYPETLGWAVNETVTLVAAACVATANVNPVGWIGGVLIVIGAHDVTAAAAPLHTFNTHEYV